MVGIDTDKCTDCKHLCVDDCDLWLHPWECSPEIIKELEEKDKERQRQNIEEIKKHGLYRTDTVDDF